MLSTNISRQVYTNQGVIHIDIDDNSGFCFGVVNAIKLAEKDLVDSGTLVSLGNIVHNEEEVERLNSIGLKSVNYSEFETIVNGRILFRAHGEPPVSYQLAKSNKVTVVDATCPVVLKLQQRIKQAWEASKDNGSQIVIYGKHGHAEVLGLVGQTNNEAIVIENELDIKKLDPGKAVVFFSQTTMSIEQYKQIGEQIEAYILKSIKIHDTICRQVANRAPKLKDFAQKYDAVVFVGGTKSSNAKYLYSVCKQHNPASIFISSVNQLKDDYFRGKQKIGICGATSTPMWLMEKTADCIETIVGEINKR